MDIEHIEDKVANDDTGSVLASRWDRLWAALIDGFIMLAVCMPVMYFTGGMDGMAEGVQPSLGYSLLMSLMGIVVFLIFNGKLLATAGQTIGKRVLKIKIVTLSDELPSVKDHLLKRYAVYFLVGQVPFIGQILSLVEVALIFGKDKRCGHDLAGGTKVVKCSQ